MRPGKARQKDLGQRQARALTTRTDIETTSDTEDTKWVESVEFRLTITPFPGDKNMVVKEAKGYMDGSEEQSFWKYRLCLDTGRTEARVAKKQTEWRTWSIYLGMNKQVFDTKLYAIGKALNIVVRGGQTGRGCASQEVSTS